MIRESVRAVGQELMEAEVSEPISGDTRRRDRLQIPMIRGQPLPSFLQLRTRCEQALVSVVQQAYVCGVSRRPVDQLVESLGLRISKSEVSRCRTRPLATASPT